MQRDDVLERRRELDADGLIVGIRPEVAFEEKQTRLTRGDLLLLYTDGLTETAAPDGELYGAGRLSAAISTRRVDDPEAILDAVLAEARSFSGESFFVDDVSLVLIRCEGKGAPVDR